MTPVNETNRNKDMRTENEKRTYTVKELQEILKAVDAAKLRLGEISCEMDEDDLDTAAVNEAMDVLDDAMDILEDAIGEE